MDKNTSILRVVIKDLGSLAKREDILNQNISVLVDSFESISKVSSNKREIDSRIRTNIQEMKSDPTFDTEFKQICSQSVRNREVSYFKFTFRTDSDNDLFILNQEDIIFNINLRKVIQNENIELIHKGLIIKYQKAFNILIVTSEIFSRIEAKELGGAYADDGKDKEMGEDPDEDFEKRKINKRKNPFYNKLTERDKMNFQLYHQDPTCNILVNFTLLNNAQGAKVLEGMIKQANTLYMRGQFGDFDMNDNLRKMWHDKITLFNDACVRLLTYKQPEAEKLDEVELAVQQQGEIRENRAQQQVREGEYSFNEYSLEDVKFFISDIEKRVPYVLPHTAVNERIFLALNPGFILDCFKFLPKKVRLDNSR